VSGAATRKAPPPRGRPYYDADMGRMRIVPKGGGPAVDYVGPAQDFNARKALRRAGMRARDEGAATARTASGVGRSVSRLLDRADVGPDLGLSRYGVGGILIFMGASIIGLALLENLLGGRGPAAYERILGAFGQGIRKLVDPSDPLVGAAPATRVAAPAGARGPVGVRSAGPAGLVPVPASLAQRPGIMLDRRIASQAEQVARAFGVKISSGYRTRAQNAAAGGAPDSDHLDGDAADYVGPRAAMERLYAWALGQGFPYVEPRAKSLDSDQPHVHISFLRP
jgi:hypothetical protein